MNAADRAQVGPDDGVRDLRAEPIGLAAGHAGRPGQRAGDRDRSLDAPLQLAHERGATTINAADADLRDQ
jgi:hypothetical protein